MTEPIEIPGQLTSLEVGPDRLQQILDIIQTVALIVIALALVIGL